MKYFTQILISLVFIITSCNPPAGNVDNQSLSDSVAGGQNKNPAASQLTADTAPATNPVKPDYNQLAGDWLRTDGGKTIRIKSVMPDGKTDAEYFNPKPIHVGRAEWLIKDNNLVLFVELQDVNYPGSAYTLQYYPVEDELAGIYYQALEKANYEVEFVRQR